MPELKRKRPTLYTIGHSNRSLEEFIVILQAHSITQIIDVRTIPKSRRLPWFNKVALKHSLSKVKIHYHHLAKLGGLRHASKTSINTAWRNLSFRGFADYMQTADFLQGLDKLNEYLNTKYKTAIMCAEALPWRCHRSLIADAEISRGFKVFDIFSATNLKPHALTPFAVVNKRKKPILIYYPEQNLELKNI